MLQRDYLTRMVQQLAQMLAAIVAGARGRGEIESRERLDTVSRTFTGLGLETLERLPYEHLHAAFSTDGTLAVERALAAARVLHARIEVAQARGAAPDATQALTAYRLLTDVVLAVGGFVDEAHERAFTKLHDGLSGAFAQPDVARTVMDAFMVVGRFDRAEDVAFDWWELEERGDGAAMDAARALYADLWARGDDELAAGGLPRPEVAEGMRAFGLEPPGDDRGRVRR